MSKFIPALIIMLIVFSSCRNSDVYNGNDTKPDITASIEGSITPPPITPSPQIEPAANQKNDEINWKTVKFCDLALEFLTDDTPDIEEGIFLEEGYCYLDGILAFSKQFGEPVLQLINKETATEVHKYNAVTLLGLRDWTSSYYLYFSKSQQANSHENGYITQDTKAAGKGYTTFTLGFTYLSELIILSRNRGNNDPDTVITSFLNAMLIDEVKKTGDIITRNNRYAIYLKKDSENRQALYAYDGQEKIIELHSSKYARIQLANFIWLDNDHLFFTEDLDDTYLYHFDSIKLEKVDILPQMDEYYTNFNIREINAQENYFAYKTDDVRGKTFFVIDKGEVIFSHTDPANTPGNYFNTLDDACFSNLNAGGYAASDPYTYAFTYYTYGNLFHPQLFIVQYKQNPNESISSDSEFDNYYEEDCRFLTFSGKSLYYSSNWYEIEDEPGESWEEWDYYSYSGLVSIKKNYSDSKVIMEGDVSFLNSCGDQIYFLNGNGNIMKIDSSNTLDTVYEGNCSALYVKDGYLYFTENNVLYRSLEGGTAVELLNKPFHYPSVIGSNLYYLTENNTLKKYNMETQTEVDMFETMKFNYFCIYGDGIYFNTADQPGIIKYMDMTKQEEKIIYEGKSVKNFILLGDYLFFSDFMDGYMKIRNDGTEYEVYCEYH